jgi:hypothetical protein
VSSPRRAVARGQEVDPLSWHGDVTVRYDAVYGRAQPAEGARRLLMAVLEDGIRTLLKHAHATRGRAGNLRREAFEWLCVGGTASPFAYERLCEALGLDAARLRARVLQQVESRPRPPAR